MKQEEEEEVGGEIDEEEEENWGGKKINIGLGSNANHICFSHQQTCIDHGTQNVCTDLMHYIYTNL